jgi:hypothetical protein
MPRPGLAEFRRWPQRIRPGPGRLRLGRLPRLPRLSRPGRLPRLSRPSRLPRLSRPGRLPQPEIRLRLPRIRLRLPRRAGIRIRIRPAVVAADAIWLVAGIALFTCYLHASRALPVNSDGASNVLQAWAMLHGNPLLRGWQLSDVSFYTTELPQYMLIAAARGLTPDVVHVAAAMTYTLLVLLAAALAKGRAAGRDAAVRICVTAGIMLAPQPGNSSFVLLLSPDHVGSCVPVLAALLLLDRCRRRWFVPPAAGLILAWALVADPIVAITGAAPLAGAALVHAYQRLVRQRRGLRAAWFELALAGCALAAVPAAAAVLAAIRSAGGFTVAPVGNTVAMFRQLPQNLMLTLHGLLVLFGSDFTNQPLGYTDALEMAHLAGLGLAAWGFCAAARRLGRQDLVTSALVLATGLSLAGYLFSLRAVDLQSSREFAAVLPFGAVLAGRVLARRLRRARLLPALALVAVAYLASLGRLAAQPPAPPAGTQLAAWLAGQHLNRGLAGYWSANDVTLDTGGRIEVRSVVAAGQGIARGTWETRAAWYRPPQRTATFLVQAPAAPGQKPYPWISSVRAAFGPPAHVYQVGAYTVLVWDASLMGKLSPPPAPVPGDSGAGPSSG